MRPLLALACLPLLAGCGGTAAPTETKVTANLREVVAILPTPTGFDQSQQVVEARVEEVQREFAQGRSDPVAADAYRSLGFDGAAIRRWQGPGGAQLVVVASRWRNHQTATNVGGGAAETLPLRDGARAWTPPSLNAARGTSAAPGDPPERTLSMAIGDVSVYLHATGPADEAAVIRTMSLAIKRLQG